MVDHHPWNSLRRCLGAAVTATGLLAAAAPASGQTQETPNILLIVSDDTGYGDLGAYGGGAGRGMPTPNLDRLANEGMTFFSFYAQPSCTPGRSEEHTSELQSLMRISSAVFCL